MTLVDMISMRLFIIENEKTFTLQSKFITTGRVYLRNYMCVLCYCSIDKVPKITSPVLVIHGTEDEVIDFTHGLSIYERCPRTVEPLWVEGAGHNDVELYGQYLERLKQFISVELPIN